MNSHPIDIEKHSLDPAQLKSEALDLVDGIPDWQPNKSFDHKIPFKSINLQTPVTTKTYNKNLNNDYWVARYTVLSETLTETFQSKFQDYLIGSLPIAPENNHTTHEKNYIHDLFHFELKPIDSQSYIIKTYYKLPFPLSKRIFYNYVHIVKESDYSLVISLSIEPKNFEPENQSESGFTIGNYTSVERITLKDKKMHWIMATASNPNGNVPFWITKMGLPGAVVNDVPGFLQYCDEN